MILVGILPWIHVSVYFIGRDMDESSDAYSLGNLQEDESTCHVRFNDWRWLVNTPVHVRFCSKMDNAVTTLHGPRHRICIANISPEKAIVGVLRHLRKIFQVPRIGQFVKIDNFESAS